MGSHSCRVRKGKVMKIALIGYGKMGQQVERVAQQRGHSIVSKIAPKATFPKITEESLREAQICIDFTHPECILEHIRDVARLGKSIVVGTTGWYDHIGTVKKIVKDHNIGLIYAPNFSIGINLFLRIVSEASALINAFDDYDVGVIEAHHNQKADSPSGTSLAVANRILNKISRKKTIVHNLPHASLPPEALHVGSLRCGSVPGTHSVIYDSAQDSITVTHEARNREGFALGAVVAAEWLSDKKGFYTMEDLFGG